MGAHDRPGDNPLRLNPVGLWSGKDQLRAKG